MKKVTLNNNVEMPIKSLFPSKRDPEMVKRFANWKFDI
jgi:hypothetical protein